VIRKVLVGLVAIGIVAVGIWAPREEFVAADAVVLGIPPAVSFRAAPFAAPPPFTEGWHLSFPDTAAGVQVLTLQLGAGAGPIAPGRFTAASGASDAVLERIAEVFGGVATASKDVLPPSAALDVRLELLGERLSAGHGDVGTTVIAGAFVAEPAGDWRAYRMMIGENGPQCFLGISEEASNVVLLARAVEDGPAIQARFRALLSTRPAPTN
jgi:hypothetical protein